MLPFFALCAMALVAAAVESDLEKFRESFPSYKKLEKNEWMDRVKTGDERSESDPFDPYWIWPYADAAYQSKSDGVIKTLLVRKDKIFAFDILIPSELVPSSIPHHELIDAVRENFKGKEYSIMYDREEPSGDYRFFVVNDVEVEAAKNDRIKEFSELFRP